MSLYGRTILGLPGKIGNANTKASTNRSVFFYNSFLMAGETMVIAIFGECCTGKSTIADRIAAKISCEVFSGKDYLRLAKNESIAKAMFQKKLSAAINGENIIYVISETEHISLIPEGALRILVTADIERIKSRFAARMHGNLPTPVATMLEKKHGCFDHFPHDMHVISGETDIDGVLTTILENKL